tara:strand:+ start:2560 stop:2913 length:354 start_codon:yes stop_codon:yes gene_type:complete
MAESKKTKKKRSVVRELGKAYASIPKEAGKAAKRYAKNTKQLVKDLPRYIKEDPYLKNLSGVVKDPLNMGDMMKVPEGKTGGGRGKARVSRNMSAGGEVTTARGSGAARPQKFRKNG